MGEVAIKQHIGKDSHQRKKAGENWVEKYSDQGIQRSETANNEFYCEHCEKSIKFGKHGKESVIQQHIQSQAHQDKINAIDVMNDAVDATGIEQINPQAKWNRKKLFRLVINKESAIKWCQEQRLLPTKKLCQQGHDMKLSSQTIKGFPRFRCDKNECNEEVSMLKGTWFEDCRSGIEKVLRYIQ